MREPAAAALLAAAVFFSACATVPPQPSSVTNGLLIARVESRGALIRGWVTFADAGVLEALDEKGEPVPGLLGASGWADGKFIYFFDLPPGRYALRSASFRARGVRYQLVAPSDAKIKRSVVLRPGAVAYLGTLVFDARWPEFGEAVTRLARIVFHWLTPWTKRPLIPRDADLRLYEPGRDAEVEGLRAAKAGLGATQWKGAIEARMRELSAHEAPKTEGLLRARELPLKEEPILSWRDTWKWGDARRSPMGLAWKRPGGEAVAVVFFTTASAKGFAGWDAAVADLRRAASASVEDDGQVYEVRVASRAGVAARVTSYKYPEGTLVGSVTQVFVTETVLVPDANGVYTARLRAPRAEFDAAQPAFREFLQQLRLGPPKAKAAPKAEAALPVFNTGP